MLATKGIVKVMFFTIVINVTTSYINKFLWFLNHTKGISKKNTKKNVGVFYGKKAIKNLGIWICKNNKKL